MRALSSTKLRFCWPGAALLVVAVGCGGSTDSTTTTGTSGGSGGSGATGGSGTTGGTGGSGGSSTGGTGGSSGTGGTGGTGQPDGGGEVVCGGMVCPPSMFMIPACCTAQDTCGVGFNGMCFDTSFDAGGQRPEAGTGVPDPNCATLTFAGFMLTGCCMTDNTCGFTSQFGGGCISLDTLRSLNLPGVNLPEGGPMSCVYPPP